MDSILVSNKNFDEVLPSSG